MDCEKLLAMLRSYRMMYRYRPEETEVWIGMFRSHKLKYFP